MTSVPAPTKPKALSACPAINIVAVDSVEIHVNAYLHEEILEVSFLMLENRVREFREKRGLTQTELAVASMVSRQTVHCIENKNAAPTVEIAIRMAQAMKIKVEDLFVVRKVSRR